MQPNPANWNDDTYIYEDGRAEAWRLAFPEPDRYVCESREFDSKAALDFCDALFRQAAEILESDREKSDILNAQATALVPHARITVAASADDAIEFFAAGRAIAREAAHDFVASVDSSVGNFGANR